MKHDELLAQLEREVLGWPRVFKKNERLKESAGRKSEWRGEQIGLTAKP